MTVPPSHNDLHGFVQFTKGNITAYLKTTPDRWLDFFESDFQLIDHFCTCFNCICELVFVVKHFDYTFLYYSQDVCEQQILTAVNDDAVIGLEDGSCTVPRDLLLLNKALYGRLPSNRKLPNLPAPLEDIIDSAVKTGADLSQVVLWNYAKRVRY